MAGNGPPPNPNAQRRNARVGLVRLPAGGYQGKIPRWPLPVNPRLTVKVQLEEDLIEELEEKELDGALSRNEATKLARAKQRLAVAQAEMKAIEDGEKQIWRRLWRTPQAAEWARMMWDREVAQYVRHKAAAEIGSLEDSKEARLRAKALGLTHDGMRALMWAIDVDEVGAMRDERGQQAATGTTGAAAADGGGAAPARRRLKAVDPGKS